ncbi:hypothetical protein [Chitinivibrio alkaliphilus]|uniref:ABC transporter substrate-binding protein n=1 Tax=Chitinivibrio alkaliphilus ACht1 TaxID=1313304 RepID=U7D6T4_9BACT|nr:hypothetical protein [Chitinivibrio alkaliphilus]ERP31648.1 hypothetical protein CALK_1512 [Chitinivibrio alkaliphilus ACht1]
MEVVTKISLIILFFTLSLPPLMAEEMDTSAPSVLVIRSEGVDFEEVVRGIRYELEGTFSIVDKVVEEDDGVSVIAALKEEHSPEVVVLMNNVQINMYREYQQGLDTEHYTPTVSVMAASVGPYIQDIENSVAIEYEIPVVTSAVAVRNVFNLDVQRIGIVHREYLSGFVEENRIFCQSEGIDLVTRSVSDANEVGQALSELEDEDIDALWIPNDNALLTQELIVGTWIPFVNENRLATIVGVEALVNPDFSFGNFAVVPDNAALGSQASNLIFDLMYGDWTVFESGATQPPLSVKTVVNGRAGRDFFGIDQDDLVSVDRVLE